MVVLLDCRIVPEFIARGIQSLIIFGSLFEDTGDAGDARKGDPFDRELDILEKAWRHDRQSCSLHNCQHSAPLLKVGYVSTNSRYEYQEFVQYNAAGGSQSSLVKKRKSEDSSGKSGPRHKPKNKRKRDSDV